MDFYLFPDQFPATHIFVRKVPPDGLWCLEPIFFSFSLPNVPLLAHDLPSSRNPPPVNKHTNRFPRRYGY
jgi:hypothetical protein